MTAPMHTATRNRLQNYSFFAIYTNYSAKKCYQFVEKCYQKPSFILHITKKIAHMSDFLMRITTTNTTYKTAVSAVHRSVPHYNPRTSAPPRAHSSHTQTVSLNWSCHIAAHLSPPMLVVRFFFPCL